MLKARDIMTREAITLGPDADLKEATRILVENKISGMPVTNDENKVIGMISEKDILNFIFSGNFEKTKVKEAMTTDIVGFSPDTDIEKISLVMGERKIRRVPILENGKLVGIISRQSILRTILDIPKNKIK